MVPCIVCVLFCNEKNLDVEHAVKTRNECTSGIKRALGIEEDGDDKIVKDKFKFSIPIVSGSNRLSVRSDEKDGDRRLRNHAATS